MEDDQNGPVICFWSSMKASEAHEIARKAALGLKWFLTANSPGGAITLAMGGERLRALQTRLVCPKNRTIESMRGTLLQTATGPMLVTYDTGLRHVRADAISQIVWDARLAERYAKTGTVKPPKQNYQWADDLCEFIDQVIQKYLVTGKPVDISVDTETMGLFPWYPDKEILKIGRAH